MLGNYTEENYLKLSHKKLKDYQQGNIFTTTGDKCSYFYTGIEDYCFYLNLHTLPGLKVQLYSHIYNF